MPDQIFENHRLVAIYDYCDGQREDLEHYVAIVKEFGAKSVLDVGCGTGCFACRLVEEGINVTGLDPAQASIDFARHKLNSDRVQWIFGDASALPPINFDLAVMTGNVAQVFLTDDAWEASLLAIHKALCPEGLLVFEVRDPARRAWLEWTRENTYRRIEIPNIGGVEEWCNVTDVAGDLVSFRWTYVFETDGKMFTSDSTLRFREQATIEHSLKKSGYSVREVRGAPDRPGKEFVFIASPE
jgi:SAM-dependent methyltransferase